MRDVVLVAVVVAFFALTVLYVRWCDRIVGPDDDDGGVGDDHVPAAAAATQPEAAVRR